MIPALATLLVPLALAALSCHRDASPAAAKRPPASPIDKSKLGFARNEPIVAASDLAQEFVADAKGASARWGFEPGDPAHGIKARPRHRPFLVSGRLLARDELMSGPDRVQFGDPARGVASCYVLYITPEMKSWPSDAIVVARTHGVGSFRPSGTSGADSWPPLIHIDCELIQATD